MNMDKHSISIKSYNKSVEWHSTKFDNYHFDKYLKKFIKKLKGKKILDVGCGNGRDLEFFIKKKFDVIGIDCSYELIKKAKIRFKKLKSRNIKILKMNFLQKLDFKNDEFDGIWACASLLHVPKKSITDVLLELKRILKKGGMLFISVKEGVGERFVKDDYGHQERFFAFFKKNELIQLAQSVGFDIIESYYIPDEKLKIGFKKKHGQKWIILYCNKMSDS